MMKIIFKNLHVWAKTDEDEYEVKGKVLSLIPYAIEEIQ